MCHQLPLQYELQWNLLITTFPQNPAVDHHIMEKRIPVVYLYPPYVHQIKGAPTYIVNFVKMLSRPRHLEDIKQWRCFCQAVQPSCCSQDIYYRAFGKFYSKFSLILSIWKYDNTLRVLSRWENTPFVSSSECLHIRPKTAVHLQYDIRKPLSNSYNHHPTYLNPPL